MTHKGSMGLNRRSGLSAFTGALRRLNPWNIGDLSGTAPMPAIHKALKYGPSRIDPGAHRWFFYWPALSNNKYKPHIGNQECARRMRQCHPKQAYMTAREFRNSQIANGG